MDARYEGEPAALRKKLLRGEKREEGSGSMWKGHWSGNFQLLSALDFLRRLMCQQLHREILAASGKLLLLVPATTFQPAGRKPNISSQKGSIPE